MNIEQIKNQWQEFDPEQKPSASSLIDNFMIVEKQARDRTLYGGLAFVIIMLFMMGLNYFVYKITSNTQVVLAIMSWIVVIAINAYRLVRIRTKQPDTTDGVLTHLEQKKSVVDSEMTYYSHLWLWLSVPLGLGMALLLTALPDIQPIIWFTYSLAFILISWFGHNYCKKYISSTLVPLMNQLHEDV